MFGRFLRTKRLLLLALVGLCATSLLPTTTAWWIGDWPRDRIQDGLNKTFLVAGLNRFAAMLRPPATREAEAAQDLATLYDEERVYNAQLRARIAEQEQRIQLLSGTNAVLRLTGYSRVSARVTDTALAVAIVDAGAGVGVATGQCVVAGDALVGTVGNVASMTASVHLATAEGTQLRVELVSSEPGPPGRRHEAVAIYGHAEDMYVVELGGQQEVEVGDVARLVDPRFPDEAHGFVIGRVQGVEADPSDPLMFRIVRITPAARIAAGRHVIILVPTP